MKTDRTIVRAWSKTQSRIGRKQAMPAILLGLLSTVLAIAQAWCIAVVLADALTRDTRLLTPAATPFWRLIALFAGLAVLRAGLQVGQETRAAAAAAGARRRLRGETLGAIITEGPALLRRDTAGGLTALVVDRIEALDGFFGRWIPAASLAMLSPAAVLVAVWLMQPRAALVLLVCGLAVPVSQAVFGIGAAVASRQQFTAMARLQSRFLDRIRGISTIVLAGRADDEAARLGIAADELRRRTMRVLRVAFLSSAALDCAFAVALVVIAVLDGRALLHGGSTAAFLHPGSTAAFLHSGSTSAFLHSGSTAAFLHSGSTAAFPHPGSTAAFLHPGSTAASPHPGAPSSWASALLLPRSLFALILVPEFFAPLRTFALAYQDRMQAAGAAEALDRLTPKSPSPAPRPALSPAEAPPTADSVRTVAARGVTVAFEHVRFTWDETRGPAIDDVSFRIPAGETVVLVGPSGSGKSTLVELLLGFVTAESGRITLNGADLASIVPQALSRMTAWIGQRPLLFAGSIRDNVLFAQPDATEDQLDQAVRAASLDGFVATLPDGLGTRIGEGGYGLSGGQAQRVAIARAFLRNAPLLLLDEPTAHLDPATESQILDSLKRLAIGRTVLMASHSSAAHAFSGRRIDLRQGRVRLAEQAASA